jgi:hypothetical protein
MTWDHIRMWALGIAALGLLAWRLEYHYQGLRQDLADRDAWRQCQQQQLERRPIEPYDPATCQAHLAASGH